MPAPICRRMAGPSLAAWQWGVIALSYVLFFVLPAVWMARKAKRDGESWLVWPALVLVGSFMGVYEYYHHRGISKARARRAAKRAESEAAEEAGRQRP